MSQEQVTASFLSPPQLLPGKNSGTGNTCTSLNMGGLLVHRPTMNPKPEASLVGLLG